MKPWQGYCLRNWLSFNNPQPNSPEEKVKRLLDRCGTLLLRDVPSEEKDTLSSYKERIVGSREINASDCPEAIAAMLESGYVDRNLLSADDRLKYSMLLDAVESHAAGARKKREKKERPSTRFDRIEAIRKANPGCVMETCPVDVEGHFFCFGAQYRVDSTQGKYAPRKTRYGDQYDMDRIIGILRPDGRVLFADQAGYLMAEETITRPEAME